MRGGRRQHRRRQTGKIRTMLACLDGGKRLCGEVDANIGASKPGKFGPCWRASTEVKGFARGGRRQHRRPMSASLCSPFPASPYAFAPGSKIFTFPPPDLSSSGPRRPLLFAPRSPLSFMPSFRGAKSSHSRRRI